MSNDDPRGPYPDSAGEAVTGEVQPTSPSGRPGSRPLGPIPPEPVTEQHEARWDIDEGGADAPTKSNPRLPAPTASAVSLRASSFEGTAPTSGAPDYFGGDLGLEDDEAWPVRGSAKGVRIPLLAAVLLALLIAAGGIWGGAALQRSQGSSTTSAFAAARANFAGAGSGASAFSRFAAGASSAATGTVTVIDGSTIYITNAAGNIVKVTLTPSTTITRDATATPADLRPGDTVVVEGATAKNGTVAASSISATEAGIARSAGGFGG